MTTLASNSNSFKPEFNVTSGPGMSVLEFTQRNIFYFILTVAIIIMIFYIINIFRFRKNKINKTVKSSFDFHTLRDEAEPITIENKNLECPINFKKYSFTFYLEIHDYYCNRGYWKCIMLKGSDIGNIKNEKCNSVINNDNTERSNIDVCFNVDQKCEEKYNDCVADSAGGSNNCDVLKKTASDNIYQNINLFERLNQICKALEIGQTGKDLFCCGVNKCGYLEDDTGNIVKMSSGQCMNYLDKYKDYCDNVYALDKKVARNSEERRVSINGNNPRYFDDYDNICSVDNLLQRYPELLPNNLELNKEIELINLAEKNNMDVGNPNVNDYSIEGLYSENDIQNYLDSATATNINECNNEALEKGYNFFAIKRNSSGNLFKLVKLDKENDLYKTNKKSVEECTSTLPNNLREGTSNCYFVSKARKPDEMVVIKCWEDIIRNYPYQSPGIWMHPYINNIRIVFTTFNTKPYNEHINDIVHPHKENPKNYNIEPIKNIPPHAEFSSGSGSGSSGECGIFNPSKYNAYREYFDIENIPINNKFHIAIVTNEKTIEVYINGALKTSQVLYGEPRYNDGKLQINPGKKGIYKDENNNEKNERILLGGTISQFKYFPFNINSANIKSVMDNTTSSQRLETGLVSQKEHGHTIEISHEHAYDQDIEQDHKHSVSDSDIKQKYYTE